MTSMTITFRIDAPMSLVFVSIRSSTGFTRLHSLAHSATARWRLSNYIAVEKTRSTTPDSSSTSIFLGLCVDADYSTRRDYWPQWEAYCRSFTYTIDFTASFNSSLINMSHSSSMITAMREIMIVILSYNVWVLIEFHQRGICYKSVFMITFSRALSKITKISW